MKNYKISVIICSIGIILISLFIVYSTYAYFTVDVEGEGKEIELTTFDKNTTITYNDTSNVSMVNAYTGEQIIKTFSVENTSDYLLYYDILFNNVVNNFEDKNDLVYKLESNNSTGGYRELSVLPSNNENIASDILIKPHEKHEYNMTITFLKKETDQSANMNKTFSSNILVTGSKGINVGETIFEENTLLKKIITESTNEESGIFYTNSSINGKTIYYYKGNNNNNNLIYNNMCFKIIRTDENYGIRLIFNGEYNEGKCSQKNYIDINKFNNKSDYNAYIGYMFGNASSNTYNNEHNNINNSNIKTILDNWYKDNFLNDTNISNSVFCNNRQTNEFTIKGVSYSKKGYGKTNTGYYNLNSGIVTYDCPNNNDRFSINNKLEYPVGLISADEVLFSGDNSFLYSNDYWTMTPAYFDGSNAYNYVVSNNKLIPAKVNTNYAIRPVIVLNKNVFLENGDGTSSNPYLVR